jgi:hypothetical protein
MKFSPVKLVAKFQRNGLEEIRGEYIPVSVHKDDYDEYNNQGKMTVRAGNILSSSTSTGEMISSARLPISSVGGAYAPVEGAYAPAEGAYASSASAEHSSAGGASAEGAYAPAEGDYASSASAEHASAGGAYASAEGAYAPAEGAYASSASPEHASAGGAYAPVEGAYASSASAEHSSAKRQRQDIEISGSRKRSPSKVVDRIPLFSEHRPPANKNIRVVMGAKALAMLHFVVNSHDKCLEIEEEDIEEG